MARDESRHAGFINQSLKDFGLGIDLGDLKRTKAYTFFKPKYIFYATYLSEKIGYARYITIFRQLEQHPEKRFHPDLSLVRTLVQRRVPPRRVVRPDHARATRICCADVNKLWIRFFLLAVYATMYVRDHTRPHAAPTPWAWTPTSTTTRVFAHHHRDLASRCSRSRWTPTTRLSAGLERLFAISQAHEVAKARGGVLGTVTRAVCVVRAVLTFGRLYLMPVDPANCRRPCAWCLHGERHPAPGDDGHRHRGAVRPGVLVVWHRHHPVAQPPACTQFRWSLGGWTVLLFTACGVCRSAWPRTRSATRSSALAA
jgi:magnesium-protoporphyrin IX monomethyl ester (oxidative) cyclase